MTPKFCNHCGKPWAAPTSRFCRFCGHARADATTLSRSAPVAPIAVTSAAAVPAATGTPIRSRRISLPKPILFAINGALGCFLGALLGELLLALMLPPPPPPPAPVPSPAIDIVFALDVTGSMGRQLEGVREGIGEFAEAFERRGVDVRVGLIAFGDRSEGEEPKILRFGHQALTSDAGAFRRELELVNMVGGGDTAESSLDALALAARQSTRPDAIKSLILITDAPPREPDTDMDSLVAAQRVLQEQKVKQLHLVINRSDRSVYSALQRDAPGLYFALSDVASGRTGFDGVIAEMGSKIAATIGGVSSRQVFASEASGQITLAFALWTAVMAIGIALSLIVGQNIYLRKRLLTASQFWRGTLGSLAAGLFAGGMGQALFAASGTEGMTAAGTRLLAWGLLGGLVGWGIAFFVPNLKTRNAVLGGIVGGVLGAGGFALLAPLFGDQAGRLVGATILGLCIGLVLAVVEHLRDAWLEVHYGPGESRSISLGEQPIRIGSDGKICTVVAPGTAAVYLSYTAVKGQIHCEDSTTGQRSVIANGDTRQAGHLTLVART